jgi:hypothetical protein
MVVKVEIRSCILTDHGNFQAGSGLKIPIPYLR